LDDIGAVDEIRGIVASELAALAGEASAGGMRVVLGPGRRIESRVSSVIQPDHRCAVSIDRTAPEVVWIAAGRFNGLAIASRCGSHARVITRNCHSSRLPALPQASPTKRPSKIKVHAMPDQNGNKREMRMMWIFSVAVVLLILGAMGINMLVHHDTNAATVEGSGQSSTELPK
jgi:hypothetical protein